jgi:hypothetical protein
VSGPGAEIDRQLRCPIQHRGCLLKSRCAQWSIELGQTPQALSGRALIAECVVGFLTHIQPL